ncbi:MAG: hypothetical protein PHC28_06740 [Flavobacterium sp.]|uniref:hypothetical protein n=1 Tax=Flavobacterium sp. TaxID=239 RepID=UPI00260B1E18|nr:hypothetical protein [Flavobacterium sp.]MDD5150167.1 hypothetical protein [Flavobacterium sp.]
MKTKYTAVVFKTSYDESKKIESLFKSMSTEDKNRYRVLYDANDNKVGIIDNIFLTADKEENVYLNIDFELSCGVAQQYIKYLIDNKVLKINVKDFSSTNKFYIEFITQPISSIYLISEKVEEVLPELSPELLEFIRSFDNSAMYDTKKKLEDIELSYYPYIKPAIDANLIQFNKEKRLIITDLGRKYFSKEIKKNTEKSQEDVIKKVSLNNKEIRQLVTLNKLVKEHIDKNYYVNDTGTVYYLGKDNGFYLIPNFEGKYYIDDYEYDMNELIEIVTIYNEFYYTGRIMAEKVSTK